ncbi:MAG: uracil-DNA glycosylase [Clostridiales bacterium]|jgi:DNA polymerase|nr:uracil-DNA glycosylase [Clostridiales bacterium]
MESSFSPVVWPEEEAPLEVTDCQKCELHHQRSRVIWGEGNPKASIILILDNPGAREEKDGKPFICGTRQTLQLAAFEAGLKMEDLYVTYILKCRPIRSYNKEDARSACMVHLKHQIQLQKPKIAFCLGNTAVQWFFENKDAEVKNLRGTWHIVKGIPTYVTYHPLAVRRRPNLFQQFAKDWENLSQRYLNENAR